MYSRFRRTRRSITSGCGWATALIEGSSRSARRPRPATMPGQAGGPQGQPDRGGARQHLHDVGGQHPAPRRHHGGDRVPARGPRTTRASSGCASRWWSGRDTSRASALRRCRRRLGLGRRHRPGAGRLAHHAARPPSLSRPDQSGHAGDRARSRRAAGARGVGLSTDPHHGARRRPPARRARAGRASPPTATSSSRGRRRRRRAGGRALDRGARGGRLRAADGGAADGRRAGAAARPREAVFVIDVSGSMNGASIEQARGRARAGAGAARAAATRFNVIQFNSTTEQPVRRGSPGDAGQPRTADAWVEGARAPTAGPRCCPRSAAPRRPGDVGPPPPGGLPHRRRGGERGGSCSRRITERLGSSRLFTIGIGSAPNSHFMREAARLGRGTFTLHRQPHRGAGQDERAVQEARVARAHRHRARASPGSASRSCRRRSRPLSRRAARRRDQGATAFRRASACAARWAPRRGRPR